MKIDVMGVQFDNITMEEALIEGVALLNTPDTVYCVTPNAEIVYEAMHDSSFCNLLNNAALVLPDGAGVILGSKLLGTPLKEKVAGIDFAANLLEILENNNKSLYLLGSKPGIGELAAQNMLKKHPALKICGISDGYFKDEIQVIKTINSVNPDVLFVCLGSPKQEKFMETHQKDLHVSMMIGLGGSLDGFAGTVKRAPKWMIRLQLEWLYRLIKEPRRIGRMMRLPKFILSVLKKRISGGNNNG